MARSIYIINPKESAPYYFSSEVLPASGISPMQLMADLTTPTVAAFVPRSWDIRMCDARWQQVDLDTDADVIAITGKVSQRREMKRLARIFRKKGKLVIAGGPHASLWPQDMMHEVDALVIGEMEDIAVELFADIDAGRLKSEYRGSKTDLRASRPPRWDLYPYSAKMMGQVQTSRGCPFECEFCDVIQYLGRKQRWKEPEQVITELEELYRRSCRDVMLADDNLTVVRKRARALLHALARWNGTRPAGRMRFATQLSIEIASDTDLLQLAVEAGLHRSFIGVEAPNEDSLKEAL